MAAFGTLQREHLRGDFYAELLDELVRPAGRMDTTPAPVTARPRPAVREAARSRTLRATAVGALVVAATGASLTLAGLAALDAVGALLAFHAFAMLALALDSGSRSMLLGGLAALPATMTGLYFLGSSGSGLAPLLAAHAISALAGIVGRAARASTAVRAWAGGELAAVTGGLLLLL